VAIGEAASLLYLSEWLAVLGRFVLTRMGIRGRIFLGADWLAVRLCQLGFDEADTKARIEQCLWGLRTSAIFDRAEAERFFAARWLRTSLEEMYRLRVHRTRERLDPSGYCSWGARLFATPRRNRAHMWQFIGEQLSKSEEARERRRPCDAT